MDIYDKQIGGSHYLKFKIQPSEFANKNNLPFAEGNAIKYICRHKDKGGKEDLKKAKHYIDMIIERDYPDYIRIRCLYLKVLLWYLQRTRSDVYRSSSRRVRSN